MFIINSIVPIFLLIAFGKVLHRTSFFPEAFYKGLNRLVYWFALPALLISRIGIAELDARAIGRIVALFSSGTFASLGVAWLAARALKLSDPQAGSFIQGAFRGNGAFIGLPVIIYTLGQMDPRNELLGTVALAPAVILFNLLGVSVLIHHGSRDPGAPPPIQTFLAQLFKNPLIGGCVIGLLINLTPLQLPLFLLRPLDALGQAALPLILISIGSSLEFGRLRGAASPTLVSALLKVVATPLLGFLLAPLFNLSSDEKMIAIFYLACPTAGMSYVMADVLGADGPLAARIIALSTLLSAITLPILIAIGL